MKRADLVLAAAAAALAAFAGAATLTPPAAAAGRYVAIGDSIAGATDSYADRFAARLGITDVHKLVSGATAVQATQAELPPAVALIAGAPAPAVVSLQIGGHDYLTGNCNGDWNRPTCDFADGLNGLLGRLRTALDARPGDEPLYVVAYYNPASGLGGAQEQMFDDGLRGADGRIDTSAHGDDWGLTDVTAWLACRYGATLVDPWAAFKAGGQALMADSLHPTPAGQQLLADLMSDPAAGGPTPACPATTPFADTAADTGDGQAHGIVEPRLSATRWWFEYGPTVAYGRSSPVGQLPPSAGTRAVAAPLPTGAAPIYHVRLVVENGLGRFAGDDRVVAVVRPPTLGASRRGRPLRSLVLAHGVALRIPSTGTTVAVRGWLRRAGRDPLVLDARLTWPPGATRAVRVPLTAGGRRVLRQAVHPRLTLRLTARGPGGVSAPVRLSLALR